MNNEHKVAHKVLQESSKSAGDAEQHTRQYGIMDMCSHGKMHSQHENTLNGQNGQCPRRTTVHHHSTSSLHKHLHHLDRTGCSFTMHHTTGSRCPQLTQMTQMLSEGYR